MEQNLIVGAQSTIVIAPDNTADYTSWVKFVRLQLSWLQQARS
jgi:hypothetical protein